MKGLETFKERLDFWVFTLFINTLVLFFNNRYGDTLRSFRELDAGPNHIGKNNLS